MVVKPCDGGPLLAKSVKLKADGTGAARFSFARKPAALQILIGPERAEDAKLAASQTITTSVAASAWADKRQHAVEPLRVSPYYWAWWLRWCREFTIRGRVVCPDGQPVPGAEVCAYDVDWWWWWWTKQEVGCAVTDINGSFDITFRWCCGLWPWWWWRYRIWEFQPELAQAIVPVLQRDPRIRLGRAENVPSLDVFEPLLARAGVNTAQSLASVPAGSWSRSARRCSRSCRSRRSWRRSTSGRGGPGGRGGTARRTSSSGSRRTATSPAPSFSTRATRTRGGTSPTRSTSPSSPTISPAASRRRRASRATASTSPRSAPTSTCRSTRSPATPAPCRRRRQATHRATVPSRRRSPCSRRTRSSASTTTRSRSGIRSG